MTWQSVVLTGLFLLTTCVLGMTHHDTLAATALGAAAGYITNGVVNRQKSPEDVKTTGGG